MKTLSRIGLTLAVTAAAGCATAMPPQDLLTARADYASASRGPAASFDPA